MSMWSRRSYLIVLNACWPVAGTLLLAVVAVGPVVQRPHEVDPGGDMVLQPHREHGKTAPASGRGVGAPRGR